MAIKIWKPCNAVTYNSSSSYSNNPGGCTNFQWQEDSNWSPHGVPQQGDEIVFSSNYNYPCVGGPGDERPFRRITVEKGFNKPIGQPKDLNEPLSLTALQVNFGTLTIQRPKANETKQASSPIVIHRLGCSVPADYPGGTGQVPLGVGQIISGGQIHVYDENEENTSSYYFSGHLRNLLFVCLDKKALSNKIFVYNDAQGRVEQIVSTYIYQEPISSVTRHRNKISVTADYIGNLIFGTPCYANVRASYINDLHLIGSGGYAWGINPTTKNPFTSYVELDGIPNLIDSVFVPGDVSVSYQKELFVKHIRIDIPKGGNTLIGNSSTQGWDWNQPENWNWTHGIELLSGIKAIKFIMSYHTVGRVSAQSYAKTVGFRIGRLQYIREPVLYGTLNQFNMTNSRQTMNLVGSNGAGAIIDQIYFQPNSLVSNGYNGRYIDITIPPTSQLKLWHHTPARGDTNQDLAPHGTTWSESYGYYLDGVSNYSSSSSILCAQLSSSSSSSSSISSSSSSSNSVSSSSSLSSSSSSSSSRTSSSSSRSSSSSSSSSNSLLQAFEQAERFKRSSSSSFSSSSSSSRSSSSSASSSSSLSSSSSSSSSSSNG